MKSSSLFSCFVIQKGEQNTIMIYKYHQIIMMRNDHYHLLRLSFIVCFLVPLCASSSCSDIPDLTYSQTWQLFLFSKFQIYFTFSLGVITILTLGASLVTWIFYPHFSLPSNIIFIITISSLINIVCHLCEIAYYKIERATSEPSNFQSFCSGIGFVSLLANLTALYYNTLFCIALAYSISNTLKKPFFSNRSMTLICAFCVVVGFLVITLTQNKQRPFLGMCIYRQANQSSLTLVFLHLVLLFLTILSLRKFKQKIPKNTYFKTSSHFRYYYIYMIIFAIAQAINVLLFLVGYFSCKFGVSDILSLLEILSEITNTVFVIQSFTCGFLRLGHPKLMIRLKSRLAKNQMVPSEDQKEMIVSLVEQIKGSEILSFIEVILFNYSQHSSKYPHELTPYHFHRQYHFLLNENVAQEYTRRRITNRQSHFQRQTTAGLKTLEYNVTIYMPEYFAYIFRTQQIHLFASFDIRKNISLVKEDSYTNSGKSGEFFFATYDHKFIFKTIKSYQAELYIQKVESFYKYYNQYPKNLFSKILGIYKFQRNDIVDESIYLMLMKNLSQHTRELNIRTYDIKGSEFNRSTLQQENISELDHEKLKKVTLKDKDFSIIQGKVHVNEDDSKEIKQILTRDLKFLSQMGVMDYSILIIKRNGPRTKQIGQYLSNEEPGTYYNIGIIDYLQEWTFRRKAQRLFKTLITNEQVTVNSPSKYSQRLIEFANLIF